jgi:hypothetical protein
MFAALDALSGIAALRARQGNIEQAFELALFVLSHRASVQDTKDRAARLRTELETQLTSQQIQAVQARVQAKTFDAIVNDALGLADFNYRASPE